MAEGSRLANVARSAALIATRPREASREAARCRQPAPGRAALGLAPDATATEAEALASEGLDAGRGLVVLLLHHADVRDGLGDLAVLLLDLRGGGLDAADDARQPRGALSASDGRFKDLPQRTIIFFESLSSPLATEMLRFKF